MTARRRKGRLRTITTKSIDGFPVLGARIRSYEFHLAATADIDVMSWSRRGENSEQRKPRSVQGVKRGKERQ